MEQTGKPRGLLPDTRRLAIYRRFAKQTRARILRRQARQACRRAKHTRETPVLVPYNRYWGWSW